MHDPNAGDEGRTTPSENEGEPDKGWFRFGDEPSDGEADAASPPPPKAAASSPAPAPVDDAPPAPASDPDPDPEPVAADEEPEERIQPFVVSATPGGVDLNEKEAADAAVITSVGGGRGFGLVGALTVMLAIFGLALFAMTGPRAADAEEVAGGGQWMSDINAATDRAAAEGKPLLVHFTADWCPPCQAMKDNVFSSAAVQERLAAQFVTVRVDLTERGGPNTRVAADFGVQSIPDLQVYHPDGWQIDRFGYVSSAAEFIGRLDRIGN